MVGGTLVDKKVEEPENLTDVGEKSAQAGTFRGDAQVNLARQTVAASPINNGCDTVDDDGDTTNRTN